MTRPNPDEEPAGRPGIADRPVDLIVIGCSAGGPPALIEILPLMPRGTATSVIVAQHMPKRFTALFADRLARLCVLPVREPREGERLLAGTIYVAAGGQQTVLNRRSPEIVFEVRPRSPTERYAPSADLLMTSVAESEETALVFGMPRGAIRAGLADLVLPRPEIALEMARRCRR